MGMGGLVAAAIMMAICALYYLWMFFFILVSGKGSSEQECYDRCLPRS